MPLKNIEGICQRIKRLADDQPTPFYVYDEALIRQNARRLYSAFSWCEGFKEYFAVKATPNPQIIRILKEEGCGVDCASVPELHLSQRLGLRGKDIFFSSNNTRESEFKCAGEAGAIINLDEPGLIPRMLASIGVPACAAIRYNPGPLREGNAIIGKPAEAKFGCTRAQVMEGVRRLAEAGVGEIGLHTMVISNDLHLSSFEATAEMMFELVRGALAESGVRCAFVNLGGGVGIPYRPEDQPVGFEEMSATIRRVYDRTIRESRLHPLPICLEYGRAMTGPFGFLVTRVLNKKQTYKSYVGVDACMSNLMRPGMYGAYHHITAIGKEQEPCSQVCDVVGSLCENNDKFAIDRSLPPLDVGDLLMIHDAGAHGYAMGFQYNGRLRCAEYLLAAEGPARLIRRAETLQDYFATVCWD
jgi:diaminopimelate decarboxylase